jgi:hypothetical protein
MAVTFPVEAGHIMMFARAVNDGRLAVQEGPEILAPPTFAQAVAQFDPDFHLRPRGDAPWVGSGATPSGTAEAASGPGGLAPEGSALALEGSALHAEMEFEYHRPMRAGDVLTVETRTGRSWEKDSRRAGRLRFSEAISEYRDASGDLVVTARNVTMRTERPVEG